MSLHCLTTWLTSAFVLAQLASPSAGQETLPVGDLLPLTGDCVNRPSLSEDGRFVVFEFGSGDFTSIVVVDRSTGEGSVVNVDRDGELLRALGVLCPSPSHGTDSLTGGPSISGDGQLVAFLSSDARLTGDPLLNLHVVLHDRRRGTNRALRSDLLAQAYECVLSAKGRFVAVVALTEGLDAGHWRQVLRIDTRTSAVEVVSRSTEGHPGNGPSGAVPVAPFRSIDISGDGRFVAFESGSNNLVPGDTNAYSDIFVRDCLLGITERVSLSSSGAQADRSCRNPRISSDGRYVAFESSATTLAPDASNHATYVHDRWSRTTVCASLDAQGNPVYGVAPDISGDGRFVCFTTWQDGVVEGDQDGLTDVFVRDLQRGVTELVSVDSQGANSTGGLALTPSISGDGRVVAFTGSRSLFGTDRGSSGEWRVYIHRRAPETNVPGRAAQPFGASDRR